MKRNDFRYEYEVEERRRKNELYALRTLVIDLIPEPYRSAIIPPHTDNKEESIRWFYNTIEKVIELAEAEATPTDEVIQRFTGWNDTKRTICPLCKAETGQGFIFQNKSYSVGFTLPLGFRRHLSGHGSSEGCEVMEVVRNLKREIHQEKWPNEIIPF